MSGVIDDKGNQWEHCHCCGEFVLIQDLAYEQPSQYMRYGRDLCQKCVAHAHGPVTLKPTLHTIRLSETTR